MHVQLSMRSSHSLPNQSSWQRHANRRDELGTVIGDSRHSPRSPQGLIGLHKETDAEDAVDVARCRVVEKRLVLAVVVVVVVVVVTMKLAVQHKRISL